MRKKITELNARFLNIYESDGETPRVVGAGVNMDCPCGNCGRQLFVPFKTSLDGKHQDAHGWDRVGESLEDLTLSPSVLRVLPHSCGWHGYIRNGWAEPC